MYTQISLSPDGDTIKVTSCPMNILFYLVRTSLIEFIPFDFISANSASTQLLKIDLKTMPLADCNKTILDFNKNRNLELFQNGIDTSQYCAHDPMGHRDSCPEDSGGPLQTVKSFSNPVKVVGVVSFGTCGRLKTSLYTRVAHYIEWIGSHVWPNGKIETLKINNNDYEF